MESPTPSYVVVACDATKDRNEHEINIIIDRLRSNGGILFEGFRLLVLGVLHKVPHPMGYQTLACPESFSGTSFRAMDEEVTKKVDAYASVLLPSYDDCENEGMNIEVKVTAGYPIRQVIVQEVANYHAAWVVLDRHLRRDLRFYLNKIPCKVALVKDDLSVDIWRSHQSLETDVTENKLVYSLSKFVSLSGCHSIADIGQSIVSYESLPSSIVSSDNSDTPRSNTKRSIPPREQFFSSDFGSSSKSDKDAAVLEWHQRYAIAIGTAKGLRFLHEECRGSPIIHRDMRPSNILLTHDFVPMLGDFGLAKWKIGSDDETMQTRIMGTFGYLAPEYAEDGIVSVRTDVYAYGIVLLQLVSGRTVRMSDNPEQPSLRQWAEPLIEKLAFHELIDPRLGESYVIYELYLMVKAAYFCVQRKPEMRPLMGEVVRLLEGQNDHFLALANQFPPDYNE